MKTIYKYQIPFSDAFSIEMPEGSEVLTIKLQQGVPTIWVLCDPSSKKEKVSFIMRGTGHEINETQPIKYIGTILIREERLVFHIFQII